MALLDKVKVSMRIDDTVLDEDIMDTIEAAKADIILSGVLQSKVIETDPLIIRAIKTYCKAEYASNDSESARYKQSYEMIRDHLSMSTDYTVVV